MGLALLLSAILPITPGLPGHSGPLVDWQIAAACIIFAVSYVVFALGKLPGLKIDRPGRSDWP